MGNSSELRNRCQQALELTKKHGADEVEIFAQTAQTITVDAENNDLHTTSSQQETMIGIRAFVNQQVGFACTNVDEDLETACADAVQLAKASPRDEHNVLDAPQPVQPVDEIFDAKAADFTAADAVAQAIRILEIAESIDQRVIIGNASVSSNLIERCIANSRGLDLFESSSLFTYFALATAKDGEQVSNMAFKFDATHFVDQIDVEPVVRGASADALGSLGAGKGESFVGPLILTPEAVGSILGGLITFQLNGKNALRGSSRWGKELGDAVAAPLITVIDDGRLAGGVSTSAFDREGTPRARTVLIENGVAKSLMHNAYTARAMGAANTGHASGSARSIPGIGPSNASIAPGQTSKDELIGEIEHGLLVSRFSGSANPISGDFSGVAKAAYLIKNGKLERPVTGTLIAGNAFEALQSLSGVSSETERVFTTTLPYIRLEDISITAE